MAKPTVALIPSAQGNKLYSVLPSNGEGDFPNFQRITKATRINSQGLVELVNSNISRLNYSQQNGCPSYLLEDSSTNMIFLSEELNSLSKWKPYSAGSEGLPIVTANQEISPDGTLNADLVSFPTSSEVVNIQFRQRVATTANTTYTFSFYAKVKDGDSQATIGLLFGSENVDNILITEEWQRIEYTDIIGDGGNKWFGLKKINHSIQKDFILWGFQLEAKEHSTSYIPNYSGTAYASRSLDNANPTSLLEINPSNGMFFYDATRNLDGDADLVKTISMYANIRSDFNINIDERRPDFNFRITVNGVEYTYRHLTNDKHNKIALQWNTEYIFIWVNGVKIETFTLTESITINEARLDLKNSSGQTFTRFFGSLNGLRIYNESLTNDELTKLTTI